MCDIVFEKAKGRGGAVNRTSVMQRQPFKGFYKKGVTRIFAKFAIEQDKN